VSPACGGINTEISPAHLFFYNFMSDTQCIELHSHSSFFSFAYFSLYHISFTIFKLCLPSPCICICYKKTELCTNFLLPIIRNPQFCTQQTAPFPHSENTLLNLRAFYQITLYFIVYLAQCFSFNKCFLCLLNKKQH